MGSKTALILSAVATIVCVVLLYAKVLPKKLDGKLNGKFAQWLHNYFHFKKLYIEEILRFFFILATVFSVCAGAFYLIAEDTYGSGRYTYSVSYTKYGLILLFVAPIVLRITYEFAMMTIIAIRNLIEINNKMSNVVNNTTNISNQLSDVVNNNTNNAQIPQDETCQPQ